MHLILMQCQCLVPISSSRLSVCELFWQLELQNLKTELSPKFLQSFKSEYQDRKAETDLKLGLDSQIIERIILK